MNRPNSGIRFHRHIRLDSATVCQLKCPACPTASGEIGKTLGTGYLKFNDFKKIVDQNPWVSHIELSNWGEFLLNRDLLEIMAYAYRKNVALYATNGANMNTESKDLLEGLVKYKLRCITCSIDGVNQKTYSKYRVNGDYDTVIKNIRTINRWKVKYRSAFPRLRWQYIAFAHNEDEIREAKRLAKELNMEFFLKLSWGDFFTKEFSPVKNKELIKKETGLEVSSREEYRQTYGQDYIVRNCCLEIWHRPQINWDGRVLGCSINYWGDYGNAFQDRLVEVLNNEAINYAREMLMGKRPEKAGIPCTTCPVYHRMKKYGDWITEEETVPLRKSSRRYILLENKVFGVRGAKRFARTLDHLRDPVTFAKRLAGRAGRKFHVPGLSHIATRTSKDTLKSRIYPLSIPQRIHPPERWKPHPLFHGSTATMKFFSCHSSVLMPGHSPHPPHKHKDEEILVMLSGQAHLILPGCDEGGSLQTTLQAGQLVFYPSHFLHTLKAIGDEAANYMMLKWYSEAVRREKALDFSRFDPLEAMKERRGEKGFMPKLLFQGPTAHLKKLHVHTSLLTPASGYAPHSDPYDVALLVLEGEIETLGRRIGPFDVVFYAAGEPHGISNPGAVTAKYIVFEFHN